MPPIQHEEYPDLPQNDSAKAEEVVKATSVSFIIPDMMIENRPWSRLMSAATLLNKKLVVLTFIFSDLKAEVTFLDEEKRGYKPVWQSYLDGRLSQIEQASDTIQIDLSGADLAEEFKPIYPVRARAKAPAATASEDGEGSFDGGDGGDEGAPSGSDDDF